VLAEADLRRLTSRTIRSPQALREDIDRGRRQDYAIVDQQLEVEAALHRGPDPRPGRRGGGGHQCVDAGSRTTVVDMRRRLLPPLRETAEAVASDLAAARVRRPVAAGDQTVTCAVSRAVRWGYLRCSSRSR
jgi:IclR family transcriptional regulator, pca regulon regulatory protein